MTLVSILWADSLTLNQSGDNITGNIVDLDLAWPWPDIRIIVSH
jgi:hypothetical protein